VQVNELNLSFDFPSNVLLPAVGDVIEISFDPQKAIQVFSGGEAV